MLTTHEERAIEIAREIETGAADAVQVTNTARQGDLLMQRVGQATGGAPVPEAGILLTAGAHGEHRLMTPAAKIETGHDGVLRVSLPSGGLVVHTDVPSARHQAVALIAGTWILPIQQELGLDDSIQRVVD